jgi:hypothetical protein
MTTVEVLGYDPDGVDALRAHLAERRSRCDGHADTGTTALVGVTDPRSDGGGGASPWTTTG